MVKCLWGKCSLPQHKTTLSDMSEESKDGVSNGAENVASSNDKGEGSAHSSPVKAGAETGTPVVTQKRNREEAENEADEEETEPVGNKKSKSEEDTSTHTTAANGNGNASFSSQVLFNNLPYKSTVSPTGDSEVIEVMQDKVGSIIGSKGAIIQELQMRTGAKIYVNQNFPEGVPRQVNITGTPSQVSAASELVRKIIVEGPTSIHVNAMGGGPQVSITIDCPQPVVGRVIGSAGATIKDLQSRSGAKIQINQDFPDGVPRKISISGTQAAVSLAAQLVNFVMENGPQAGGMLGSMGMGMGGMGGMGMGGGMGGGMSGGMGGGGWGGHQSMFSQPFQPPAISSGKNSDSSFFVENLSHFRFACINITFVLYVTCSSS